MPLYSPPSTAGFTVPYKFNAYQSADSATISASTWTKVQLNTENFDTGNNFDNATNFRFTAPVAGFYFLSGQVGVTNTGATSGVLLQAALYKNGAALAYSSVTPGSGSGSSIPRAGASGLFQLAATDFIELYGNIGEAGRVFQGTSPVTFMSGWLVSTI